MSDSTDDEQPLPKRICASTARSQLGATEKVLRTLACELKTNPHYRCAAPMRLYDTQEVQEAVQKAEADKQYRQEHRDTLEAEKLAKQKEAAKKKADTAAQACAQFSKEPTCTRDFAQGSHQPTKLPLDAWGSILEKLCPTALSALEAPSTVARHIINAQLICRESCAASGAAWAALAALIQADCPALSEEERMFGNQKSQNFDARTPASAACHNLSWEESVANPLRSVKNTLHADIPWDQVVSNPLSLKNDVLKEACRSVGEQVSGTKAVLVLRLLKFFGVDRPCAVPAIVLLAVKHEKVLYQSTQLNQPMEVRLAVRYVFNNITQAQIEYGKTTMFAVRKVLASHFQSVSQLLQFYACHVPAHQPQIAGKSCARQVRDGKKRKRKGGYTCGCGNQPAPTCQQGCCKNCCQGPCARHNC